jgi:Uma2 family endonuclease
MEKITNLSQLDLNGTYTYADYLTWKFEQTVELIKGHLLKMSAPNRKHQEISWQLSGVFFTTFKNRKCKAYAAPFDVRLLDKNKSLKENKDVLTVVQPDLCIICDKSKLDEKGGIGAPDLIVEILSPGNSTKEMKTKKLLYEECGVREYWVIDPTHETLIQYFLQENGTYSSPQIYVSSELVQSAIFPELQVALMDIFESDENEEN